MATYTSKLNLKKPASNDYVNIADINGNMDILDKAVLIDNVQAISGAKVFTNDINEAKNYPVMKIKDTGQVRGNTITESRYIGISFRDNNEKNIGYLGVSSSVSDGVRGMYLGAYCNSEADNQKLFGVYVKQNGDAYTIAPHRSYSTASNDDVLVKSHVAELPVVHLTGNENIGGNKNLTGLTTLTMSRAVATGGTGYTILYRFKNTHVQTLFFTGGRTIVMAQVSPTGGFKGQLFTSGRDYKTTHWLWVTTDANTGDKYLVCKGMYSATMNMYVLNSFMYGAVYPFQDDIEVVNQTTTDPTTNTRWSNVTEVANYD